MNQLTVLVSAYACYPPTTAEADAYDRQLAGGESILGWNLIGQIARFHRVVVLTEERNRPGIEKSLAGLPQPNVEFRYVSLPVRWKRFWHNAFVKHLYYFFWQMRALAEARALQAERGFEIAHHITYANDWMPSYIGAFLPVPFIWGPIGGGQRYPKGFQREFPLSVRLGELGRVSAQGIGRHLIRARRRCANRARAILVCNAETKDLFPPRLHGKIEFFPVTGVSQEDLGPPVRPRRPDGVLRVLTTGRLVPFKRFDFAIRAFGRFLSENPGTESLFEIVGEGPEGPRLERLVKDLALGDRVRFIGWLSRNDVLAKMQECDIFLFPSLREGGGIVLIEAMACGKPVICLDTAGPGFHIQDGWGIKVEPRSPEYVIAGLARALGRLAGDAGLRERLGAAARMRMEEYYVWDRLGERLRDIYARAMAMPKE